MRGIRGGRAYGASDYRGAYVKDAPVSPPDLQATVLYALGIPPGTLITDRQGRPHHASRGQPVTALW